MLIQHSIFKNVLIDPWHFQLPHHPRGAVTIGDDRHTRDVVVSWWVGWQSVIAKYGIDTIRTEYRGYKTPYILHKPELDTRFLAN